MLQVDMRAALTKKMESFANDVRGLLRDKRIQYSGVSREGQTIVVRFRDRAARDRAMPELDKALRDLDLRTQEDSAEFRIFGALKLESQRRTQEFALQQ